MTQQATYDIQMLNREFGAPGRIAFRPGPCGEPVAVLVEEHGACEVSLYGGHVLSYRPRGHSPVLWLSKSAMATPPGKAIRGGIPVCWPWFGAHPDGAGPSHGFARTARWNLLDTSYDSYSTSVSLLLEDSPETRAAWPHPFRLELKVSVGANLRVSLSTTNTGAEPLELTEALHSYFLVKDVREAKVLGLDGVRYLDKAPGGIDGVQAGDISFCAETDRVYVGTTGPCEVDDPAIRRKIRIEKEGSAAAVVWNPWVEKASKMADMAPEDYLRFVCVETANAGGAPVIVAPGATHTLATAISAQIFHSDGRPVEARNG
jgi:D-hexose-6-phosphate mutarotase